MPSHDHRIAYHHACMCVHTQYVTTLTRFSAYLPLHRHGICLPALPLLPPRCALPCARWLGSLPLTTLLLPVGAFIVGFCMLLRFCSAHGARAHMWQQHGREEGRKEKKENGHVLQPSPVHNILCGVGQDKNFYSLNVFSSVTNSIHYLSHLWCIQHLFSFGKQGLCSNNLLLIRPFSHHGFSR